MNKIRYIIRAVFLVLAIILLIDLNQQTDDHAQTIAEFKVKTLEKVLKDTLDTQHKLNLVLDETTKFMDNSSQVKRRIHYLLTLLGLFVITEVIFIVLKRRSV